MSAKKRKNTLFTAFYGPLTWSNTIDWLITLMAGGLIGLYTLMLGGVRPEAERLLLPLFSLSLCLHGFWVLFNSDSGKRINPAPLFFVPLLIWVFVSVQFFSPVPWLGKYELISAVMAFILFWIASNHLRMWSHMWMLFLMIFLPVGYGLLFGFFQFFQFPDKIVNAFADVNILLAPQYFGMATGTFADPSSFSVILIIALPTLIILGAVARAKTISRIMCYYLCGMLFVGLILAQQLWVLALLPAVAYLTTWFTARKLRKRLLLGTLFSLGALVICLSFAKMHPRIGRSYNEALQPQGEVMRLSIWSDSIKSFSDNIFLGGGGGSYSTQAAQSRGKEVASIPELPMNDYLLLFCEYGLIGSILLLGPLLALIYGGYRSWRDLPHKVTSESVEGSFMPKSKIVLAVSVSTCCVILFLTALTSVYYIPALLFISTAAFAVLSRVAYGSRIELPKNKVFGLVYFTVCLGSGAALHLLASPAIASRGIYMNAEALLNHVLEDRVQITGSGLLLDEIILGFVEALEADPSNVDAMVGMSIAQSQLFYRDPAQREQVVSVAKGFIEKALEYSPEYWKAWLQYGVVQSMEGDFEAAEKAFERTIELAPKSVEAYYYYASFNAAFPDQLDVALEAVETALEINPNYAPARSLKQKLLIL